MGNAVLQRLVDERASRQENIDRILDRANEEERDPTESERELITKERMRIASELDPMIGELLDVEETRGQARDARAALTRRRETPEEPPPDNGGDGDDDGEGGEPAEYRRFAHYARDFIICRFDRARANVPAQTRQRAAQRLERAVSQVLVADVGPLVSPQYINEIMQVINKARPIVASSRQVPLSSGKVQFPKLGTRPTVAKQATEKTEAGVGAMTVTFVEVVADTYLTAGNFSWQVIQWSNPDALTLWFDLAAADYAKKTEAAAGTVLAGADAAPTAVTGPMDLAKWMAAIAGAAAEVYANTGRYANTLYLNPADAYPLVALVGNVNPTFLATGNADLSTGTWPAIAGLSMVVSSGIPAKSAIVGDSGAFLTAETPGSPVDLRAVEPSIGGIEVGIIGAFTSAVTDAGAFAVVLEMVPGVVAKRVTHEVAIPTIGIGAGPDTDAQVLVWQDMAGLRTGKLPRFVKQYADIAGVLAEAAAAFATDVRDGAFPAPEHTF